MKYSIKIIFLVYLISSNLYSRNSENDLLIYAAASLRDALTEIIILYNKKKPQSDIVPVYLATSNLAQQIKNGADPDIFISASKDWMDYLLERKLVLEKYTRIYLLNSLVLISSTKKDFAKIKDLEHLKLILTKSKKRISLAMTRSVPAGIYAKDYLKNINIWKQIKNNIVESPNVRAAMQFVSRGDLDYGIIYYSDTIGNKKINILYNLENNYHRKIIYPITALNERKETLDFYNFLINNDNLLIMKKWGFKIKDD